MRSWVMMVLVAAWLALRGAVRAERIAVMGAVAHSVRLWATGAPRFREKSYFSSVYDIGPAIVIGLVVGGGLAFALRQRALGALADRDLGALTDHPRAERFRTAAMAAGIPMPLLAGPVVLVPVWWHDSFIRSALNMARTSSGFFGFGVGASESHPGEFGSAIFAFAWPVLLGGISLACGLHRRAPSALACRVVAAAWVLGAPASINLVLKWGSIPDPLALGVLFVGLLAALWALRRGFRREGWERWGHVVASGWLFYLTVAVVLLFVWPNAYGWLEPGLWCVLLALSAALPGMAWALVPMPGENAVTVGQ